MAGERSGSVLAVRSTASPRGRMSFGGRKPGFESVGFINLNSPSFSTRVNSSPDVSQSPQYEPLRAKHLNALLKLGEGLRFKPEPAAKTEIPEVKNVNVGLVSVAPDIHTLEPKVESVSEVRPGTIISVKSERVEFVSPLRVGDINLPTQRTLSPIEQAAIRMRVENLRARLRRPTSQAIPMVLEKAETAIQPQPASEFVVVKNKQVLPESKTKSEQTNASSIKTRNSLATKREIVKITQEKAVVDYKVNRLRISVLIATRDRIRALGKGDLRDEIVKESGINESRELRSSILEFADLRRRDGTQPGTGKEISLNSGELTNDEIKKTVFNHTAVKIGEGEEVGRKELYEVMTPPDEPHAVFDEEQVLPKKKEFIEERAVDPVTVSQEFEAVIDKSIKDDQGGLLEETAPVEILSRPFNFFDSSIASVSKIGYPRLHREELVLN